MRHAWMCEYCTCVFFPAQLGYSVVVVVYNCKTAKPKQFKQQNEITLKTIPSIRHLLITCQPNLCILVSLAINTEATMYSRGIR